MYNITLFCFCDDVDLIAITAFPRIIKTKNKNISITLCIKECHKQLFNTNPYIDNIIYIDNLFANKNRFEEKLGLYENEINLWNGNKNTNDPIWLSAKKINNFFNKNIIEYSDNLMPDFFYTEDEISFAKSFASDNFPYCLLEVDIKNKNCELTDIKIMNLLSDTFKKNMRVYVPFKNKLVDPYIDLYDLNIRQLSLIASNSCFFIGTFDSLMLSSFEQTLCEPQSRIIAAETPHIIDNVTRHNIMYNTTIIPKCSYIKYIKDVIGRIV